MKNKKAIEQQTRGWVPKEITLPANAHARKTKFTARKRPPTIRERLVGGLGAAGGSLTLSAIIFYFVPVYPKQAVVMLLISGVPLLVAAFLVSRTKKRGTEQTSA